MIHDRYENVRSVYNGWYVGDRKRGEEKKEQRGKEKSGGRLAPKGGVGRNARHR